MDQQEASFLSFDDIMMSGNPDECLPGNPHTALAQITSYYQDKIVRDIDDMARHFAETLSFQEINIHSEEEVRFGGYSGNFLFDHSITIKFPQVASQRILSFFPSVRILHK